MNAIRYAAVFACLVVTGPIACLAAPDDAPDERVAEQAKKAAPKPANTNPTYLNGLPKNYDDDESCWTDDIDDYCWNIGESHKLSDCLADLVGCRKYAPAAFCAPYSVDKFKVYPNTTCSKE
jgi:hypothetical protein